MKSVLSFITITSLVLLTACTKHSGDMEAPPAAVKFTFASPTENGVYNTNDSISIQGTAIALTTLHGYDLIIKNAADTTLYFSKHVHDHNDTLVINEKWKGTFTKSVTLEAQVTFAIDHDGNKFSKKVAFKVQ